MLQEEPRRRRRSGARNIRRNVRTTSSRFTSFGARLKQENENAVEKGAGGLGTSETRGRVLKEENEGV